MGTASFTFHPEEIVLVWRWDRRIKPNLSFVEVSDIADQSITNSSGRRSDRLTVTSAGFRLWMNDRLAVRFAGKNLGAGTLREAQHIHSATDAGFGRRRGRVDSGPWKPGRQSCRFRQLRHKGEGVVVATSGAAEKGLALPLISPL